MPKRKETSSSASSKPTAKKRSTLSSRDIADFRKLYGWALYHSATMWNYHSDSGCFYETCQDMVEKAGDWTAIYKPTKAMKDYESDRYVVLFIHSTPLPAAWSDKLSDAVDQIHRVFLESYDDVLDVTGGKWSIPIHSPTIDEIAQITAPLTLERGNVLKMSFALRGMAQDRSSDSWTPYRLGKLLGYVQEDDPGCANKNASDDEFYWFTNNAPYAVKRQ